MGKLTLVAASELAEGEDILEIRRLDASGKGVTHVEDLSPCVELTKLNLSKNSIESMEGLVCCTTLTWLDLSHNQLDSLVGIQALTNLAVLSASCNMITTCGDLSSLKNLKALILSSNRLSGLTGLSALKDLNTLVLSHNCFKSISVEKLTKLAKLSLSHNSLSAIPNVQHNSELRELRLNGNRIARVPESLQLNSRRKLSQILRKFYPQKSIWMICYRLALLDLGNNKLRDLSFLDVLRYLRSLKNLNLKGNTFYDSDDYQVKVLDAVRSVQVLDGRKRATIVILGGGKRKASVVSPGILKMSPRLKKPGGNMVGAGDDKAVSKKVHFDESQSKETRPKKKKRKRHEEGGDECGRRLLKPVSTEDGEPAAKPKKRKREHDEDCLLGGTPQKKKHRLRREDNEAAASSIKQKKHDRKKKPVSGFRVNDDHSLLGVSNSKRKHKQCTNLGPQPKRDTDEDAPIPSSLSLATHEAVATSQCEKPGLVPASRKGKKSNAKMLHSGVVLVERAKFHHRRKKRRHGYSPTDILPRDKLEIGVGHESTWT